jgi:hypothetical protein
MIQVSMRSEGLYRLSSISQQLLYFWLHGSTYKRDAVGRITCRSVLRLSVARSATHERGEDLTVLDNIMAHHTSIGRFFNPSMKNNPVYQIYKAF